jgi:aspartate/methionine/tyrosine aminotransferase
MGSTGSSNEVASLKPLNHAFSACKTTVFEVMSKLAAEHKSINLGQGFPDEEGPEPMKKVASDTLYTTSNQYPSLMGTPELRQAVARHSEKYQGIPLDWNNEVVITVGATEGIASALMGLVNPGDEVGSNCPQIEALGSQPKDR